MNKVINLNNTVSKTSKMKKTISMAALLAVAGVGMSLGGNTAEASEQTYTVKSGDTLNAISVETGVGLQTLADVNNIKDISLIYPGQSILLDKTDSAKEVEKVKEDTVSHYTVKSGDTLSKIGDKHEVSVNELKVWNGLTSDLIFPGQELKVTGEEVSNTQVNELTATAPSVFEEDVEYTTYDTSTTYEVNTSTSEASSYQATAPKVEEYEEVQAQPKQQTQQVSQTPAQPKQQTQNVNTGSNSSGQNWGALANCESGGNASVVSSNGLYHGLYQFDAQTWQSVGGSGVASDASAAEQTQRAQKLYEQRGSQPWPVCGANL